MSVSHGHRIKGMPEGTRSAYFTYSSPKNSRSRYSSYLTTNPKKTPRKQLHWIGARRICDAGRNQTNSWLTECVSERSATTQRQTRLRTRDFPGESAGPHSSSTNRHTRGVEPACQRQTPETKSRDQQIT